MILFHKYIEWSDKINNKLGSAASWLVVALILIITYDVIVRYLFQSSSVAMQELEWHLFAIIFLLSAGYTLKIDDHVRVDVFYSRFSEKKQAWINLLGTLFFLIPFCVILIISSENFVLISFKVGETSPDAGGLPARYILKAFIPISFFFLLLQGIALAFKSIIKISNSKKLNATKD
ncbi:MAG: TRAP transporter small permease subunit [Ignavibacteriaceae bacterium]|nr:TRAP transporter small permease subunit [Ignavibacteria bacterium]NNL21456.1 TRAP transporter small permease subunit [Ignavibacteriaceae bacterium]